MKSIKAKHCNFFSPLFLFLLTQLSFSQTPDFSKVTNVHSGDSANIVHLIKNGVRIKNEKVIAWFPKDSLSEKRMKEILDTLNIGVTAAEKFIKAPLPWQVQQKNDFYTFYFRLDSFISHASFAGFVSVPFWRIKEGKAPWLHEAMHEMLNTKRGNWLNATVSRKDLAENMPLWLAEGLPEYIAMQVSQQHHLPHFDPHSNGFYKDVDSLCKDDLRNEKGEYILSYIGRKGVMLELFGKDRRSYAPAFYHCSCSFVKYLVSQNGIEILLNSLSAYPRELEELEKLMTPSLEVMKKSWVEKLKME